MIFIISAAYVFFLSLLPGLIIFVSSVVLITGLNIPKHWKIKTISLSVMLAVPLSYYMLAVSSQSVSNPINFLSVPFELAVNSTIKTMLFICASLLFLSIYKRKTLNPTYLVLINFSIQLFSLSIFLQAIASLLITTKIIEHFSIVTLLP